MKRPKTVASEDNVPVIEPLAAILDEYRQSMRNPQAGPMFVSDDGSLLDLDKLGTRLIRPAIRTIGMTWHGWQISDKPPKLYLPEMIEKSGPAAFDAQCIPTESSLLGIADYGAFLHQRRALISHRLNQFLGSSKMTESAR